MSTLLLTVMMMLAGLKLLTNTIRSEGMKMTRVFILLFCRVQIGEDGAGRHREQACSTPSTL